MSNESIERFDPEVCEARDEGASIIAVMAPASTTGRQGLWVRHSDYERIVKENEAESERLRKIIREHRENLNHWQRHALAASRLLGCGSTDKDIETAISNLKRQPSLSDAIKEVEKVRDEYARERQRRIELYLGPELYQDGRLQAAEDIVVRLKSLGPQGED